MEHPITPPPKLVQQRFKQAHESADPDNQLSYYDFIATAAAQWGADQELEACCEWFAQEGYTPNTPTRLRAARRPKPPSLKEQALAAVAELEGFKGVDTIRRALEALPND